MCSTHLKRWQRNGTLRLRTPEQRFWTRVRKTETCWLWTGSRHQGRGQWHGRYAHRVAWEMTMGPVPAGRMLAPTCAEPLCVRPAHHVPARRSYIQPAAVSAPSVAGT
jgi:hypothetical protein